MRYCQRCLYPENAKPTIIFDDRGVCSGCRTHEAKSLEIDWDAREVALRGILEEYKIKARGAGNIYDCIIPVSGGKDSHYQVYLVKEVYGLNPLLVTYNHAYNTPLGIRNINNLVKQFDCDLIRHTTPVETARKISRYMLARVGDLTWHYHTGIFTFPFQIAVKWKIPLVLWGEHGHAEMTGVLRLEDLPEFTNWTRQEYQMRGVRVESMIEDPESGLELKDVGPLLFPSDDDMEDVEVRGLYLGVYLPWEHLEITRFLVENYAFKMYSGKRDRTFSLFHKVDDHANDFHDYLKYLKFGYGRGTDHASWEIRQGRMTREEGIEMAKQYDSVEPSSFSDYLEFLGMSREELMEVIDPLRDSAVWQKNRSGHWMLTDCVANHINDPGVDVARLPLVPAEEKTFGVNNQGYYYTERHPNAPVVDDKYCVAGEGRNFVIL